MWHFLQGYGKVLYTDMLYTKAELSDVLALSAQTVLISVSMMVEQANKCYQSGVPHYLQEFLWDSSFPNICDTLTCLAWIDLLTLDSCVCFAWTI